MKLALLVLGLSASAALACDDGAPVISVVGTLSGDRVLVREERFGGSLIRLYVLDLAKSTLTEFATVLDGEPEAERPKLRAARWKAAEAELKKQGLLLKTLAEQSLPFRLKGATVKSSTAYDSDTGCSTVELVAVRGKQSQTLDTTGSCGASDGTFFSGVVVTPDQRFLIPMLASGCLGSPTLWMKAIATSSFPGKN